MSVAERSLGTHRLSVRRSGNRKKDRAPESQSTFCESLDFDELELTGDVEYRSVGEGDARRIETVGEAMDALDDYIENKEGASLVLHEEEEGEVLILPYNHRWTKEYRDMLYSKLKDGERWLKREFGGGPIPTTLLSLTAHQTDEDGNPRPPGEVLKDLSEGWEDFRKALDRTLEGWWTEYMLIVEPHESGYPHLHVAIFGAAKRSIAEKVQELWVEKYGVGGADAHEEAVSVGRGRQAQLENPAAYLMKYLTKTTVRASGETQEMPGFEAFAALLWVTGKRQFSCSEGLSSAMKRSRGESDLWTSWEFVGVGYGLSPGGYSGREAQDLLDHLASARWQPPPGAAVAGHVRYGSVTGEG